ncbi:MAG: hypothetical protein ACPGSC_08035 [Granulosicoccaceae bacterium]
MKTLKSGLVLSSIVTLFGCGNLHSQTPSTADAKSADISIPQSVQSNCLSCHSIGAKHEPTNAIAPPLFAVKNHLSEFSNRDAFIAHVSDWVKNPDSAKARMPGAVKKFGLMPALPLEQAVLTEIAAWIYDTPMEKPNWYAEHFRKEHGKAPAGYD